MSRLFAVLLALGTMLLGNISPATAQVAAPAPVQIPSTNSTQVQMDLNQVIRWCAENCIVNQYDDSSKAYLSAYEGHTFTLMIPRHLNIQPDGKTYKLTVDYQDDGGRRQVNLRQLDDGSPDFFIAEEVHYGILTLEECSPTVTC